MNDAQMDRRSFLVGGLTLVAAGSGRLLAGEEDSRLTAAKRWFTEAQFGMMAHWGLYSVLAGEYRGKRMDRQFLGEWIQSYYRIPNAEYEKLARTFNPIYFNADEWVQIARDAGMKYLVFTSKHHDGFAMYRSRVSKFNVVEVTVDDRTPNTRWNPGAGILRSVSLKRAAALRWNPRTCSSGSFRRIHLRHLQGGLPLGGGTQWSRTAA